MPSGSVVLFQSGVFHNVFPFSLPGPQSQFCPQSQYCFHTFEHKKCMGKNGYSNWAFFLFLDDSSVIIFFLFELISTHGFQEIIFYQNNFSVKNSEVDLYSFFHVAPVIKNLLATAGDTRDVGSIPELERSPGRGHGNPLQHSYLENSMDRGVQRAIVYGVAKSQTECTFTLHDTHIHKSLYYYYCGQESLRRNGVATKVKKRV